MKRWLLILAVAFGACMRQPDTGCTPGVTQSCSCPNFALGAQACNPDRVSFSACRCDSTTTPPVCNVGESRACSCAGRMTRGAQECTSLGSIGNGWDACVCPRVCDTLTEGGATPLVTISLASALFGVAQTNGEAWDSTDRVAQSVINGLMALLDASGQPKAVIVSRILSFFSGSDFAHYDKPDGAGFADIFVRGAYMTRIAFIGDEDSFSPSWAPYAGSSGGIAATSWMNAPLGPTLNVRVTLRDRDTLSADDPAGTFVLTYDNICEAMENGGVYQARVAEMTSNQTLFFGFSVARQ